MPAERLTSATTTMNPGRRGSAVIHHRNEVIGDRTGA
jgi:hypothetical protein